MRTIRNLTSRDIALLRLEPQGIISLVPRYELPRRIVDRLTVDDSTGCWLISGWNSGNGFANVSVAGRTHKVHRVTYTLIKGPIPPGLILDHKKTVGCAHRNCGNPDHLEPVTVRVNTERGSAALFQPRSAS